MCEWEAAPMKKRDGSPDRLKRWHVLGELNGRAQPVIADKIRTEENARLMAASPELLKALKHINEIIFAEGAPLGSDNYFKIREICCNSIWPKS